MSCLSHVIKEPIPEGLRLDRYVSEYLRVLSRSQIKARNLIAKIKGKEVKLSQSVKQGDCLDLLWDDSPVQDIIPENIPLDIIYEDKNCVVINKPQGLVVHPGAGNRQGTLANALYFKILNMGGAKTIDSPGINQRSCIVHRLDKETSGVIIAAWNEEAQAFLCDQFKSRKVKKTYAAIVLGVPKEKNGRIETFIARDSKNRKKFAVREKGKASLTFYKVIKNWQNYSLLLLRPKTGRTHQLRVHLEFLGHPILGDPLYGRADKFFPDASLMLHSKRLEITLPEKKDTSVFTTALPERFLSIIKKLDNAQRGKNE